VCVCVCVCVCVRVCVCVSCIRPQQFTTLLLFSLHAVYVPIRAIVRDSKFWALRADILNQGWANFFYGGPH